MIIFFFKYQFSPYHFLVPRVFQPSFVDLGPKLGVLSPNRRHCQKWSKSGPEAEKQPAERLNGLLPENRSYPELPQDVGKL